MGDSEARPQDCGEQGQQEQGHEATPADNVSVEMMEQVGIVVVGAELETALHRTFPAVFRLFCTGILPHIKVVGVTGEDFSNEQLRARLEPSLGAGDQDAFLSRCEVVSGDFRTDATAQEVHQKLQGFPRVMVYVIPPQVLCPNDADALSRAFRDQCSGEEGWLRCVIEKPLGRDVKSAMQLSHGLARAFQEKNIYRLDHFLGKEMVQNIVALRFANRFLEPSWNNNNINAVVISCREAKMVKPPSYAKYFDKYGIIREIMMDHLMHMMALVAMETPVSLTDGTSLRDEVAKVLRCVEPVKLENTVLGQYEGYKDTEGVAPDSLSPTFATCVVYINNPRWHGVPFILKTGKGMYERRTDIRVQFKPPHNMLFPSSRGGGLLNELVIRVQPNRDIYMKMMRKMPGTKFHVAATKLDLLGTDPSMLLDMGGQPPQPAVLGAGGSATGAQMDGPHSSKQCRPSELPPVAFNSYSPDSYERLINDVLKGDLSSFTRDDELEALWRTFTPMLEAIENRELLEHMIIPYAVGSRGPREAYTMMESVGFLGYKLESELLGAKETTVMQRLLRQFGLSAYQMEEITSNFLSEFSKGLDGDPDATIKMLPSFVTKLPSGKEEGVYYALDLGGTNFRVTRFVFDGKRGVQQTDERKYTVPQDIMTGTGEALFDFLAECVASLDVDEGSVQRTYGFTFSFPMHQDALNEGRLLKWTKGFTASDVVGVDVVGLLEAALERRGFSGKVVSIANDTVGTLMSSAFSDPNTMIGVILGTGTNAAYVENVENIRTLPEEVRAKGGEMVIDTEWGNFGSSSSKLLPSSEVDEELDAQSRNAGEQLFEKMISGMYLGEIARLCLVKLHEAGEIWASPETTVPDTLRSNGAFPSRALSDIEYDMTKHLMIVERVENGVGIFNSCEADRVKLKEVCGMVVQRAAKLTACAIAAAIRQIGPERGVGCTVGIDGSVYQHHPSFRQRLHQGLGELACQCNVVLAKDGSGKGSALIACGAVNAAAASSSKA